MVSITLKDFKSRHNESIFLLNELLEQLDIIGVSEVVLSKTVDVVHQFVLSDRQGALWPFMVVHLLLC